MRRKGFTLIELLVVVAIIGLLASVVIASLQTARMKGRDARRIADLAEIRTALELYVDTNGYYPQSVECGWDCGGYTRSGITADWNTFSTYMAAYIPKLPVDPLNPSNWCGPWTDGCYTYSYGNVGRTTQRVQYDLTAQLENTNNSNRCGVKDWLWSFGRSHWCTAFGGSYSNQIYEASPD